eukprot:174448_1
MPKILLFLITFLVSFALSAGWTYNDQDVWSGSCNTDDNIQQSPINIRTPYLHECDTNTPVLYWNVSHIDQFRVENVQSHFTLNFELISDEHPEKHGALRNNFAGSSNEHPTFILHSAHIHWNSEHTINGRRGGLEVHFVHYSSDYDNITQSLSASPTDTYALAVVAVIFDTGAPNDFFSALIGNDDFEKLQDGNSIEIGNLDIHKLLPFDEGETAEDIPYYHYKGSLTTPPCSPIVQWHVLKEKLSISKWQMKQLRKIKDEDGNKISRNYRNLQQIVSNVHLCNGEVSKQSYSASSSDSSSGESSRASAEISDKTSHNDTLHSTKTTINSFLADFGTILLIVCIALFVVTLLFGVFYCHCKNKIQRRKAGHVKIGNDDDEDDDDIDDVELDGLVEGTGTKVISA